MEFLSLCSIVLTTVLIILFLKMTAFYGGKGSLKKQQQLLPPGPWRLPIIGSLHHVSRVVPHRRMMELSRRHGPLMHLMLGEVPAVVVSSAEVAALVLKTNDPIFASRPSSTTLDIFGCGGRGIAFAPYGDHWRQMRKMCILELLSPKQVKRMEGVRIDEIGNLIGSITTLAGATINVSKKVTACSNDVITRAVFGRKFATKQEDYIQALGKALQLAAGFSLVDLFPSSLLVRWLSNDEGHIRKVHGRIQEIIVDIIDERRAAGHASDASCGADDEDLLDVLLRLQQDNSLEFPVTEKTIGAVLFVSIYYLILYVHIFS
jgi:cytochrome P450